MTPRGKRGEIKSVYLHVASGVLPLQRSPVCFFYFLFLLSDWQKYWKCPVCSINRVFWSYCWIVHHFWACGCMSVLREQERLFKWKVTILSLLHVINQTALKWNPKQHWQVYFFLFISKNIMCLLRNQSRFKIPGEELFLQPLKYTDLYISCWFWNSLSVILWFLQRNKASSGKYKAKVQRRRHWQNQEIYIKYTAEIHTVVVRQADTIECSSSRNMLLNIRQKKGNVKLKGPILYLFLYCHFQLSTLFEFLIPPPKEWLKRLCDLTKGPTSLSSVV